MPKTTTLDIYTVPSTFVRDNLPPTEQPFRQVIGLRLGSHVVRIAEGPEGQSNSPNRQSYEVPTTFANRLVEYAERGFGDGLAGQDPKDVRNCFHIGVFMTRGIFLPTKDAALPLIHAGARHTPPVLEKDLEIGDLSVIRAVPEFEGDPVSHALVRLSARDYIQVMTLGGQLGITTLDEAIGYRQSPAYRQTVVEGWFGLDPTTWRVGHFAVDETLRVNYER
jgi:hypothetical protein